MLYTLLLFSVLLRRLEAWTAFWRVEIGLYYRQIKQLTPSLSLHQNPRKNCPNINVFSDRLNRLWWQVWLPAADCSRVLRCMQSSVAEIGVMTNCTLCVCVCVCVLYKGDVGVASWAWTERSEGRSCSRHNPLTDSDHWTQTTSRRRTIGASFLRPGPWSAGGRHLTRDPRRSCHHLHRWNPSKSTSQLHQWRQTSVASLCPTKAPSSSLLLSADCFVQASTRKKTRSVFSQSRIHYDYSLIVRNQAANMDLGQFHDLWHLTQTKTVVLYGPISGQQTRARPRRISLDIVNYMCLFVSLHMDGDGANV